MSATIIIPTVGRMIHYYPAPGERIPNSAELPLSANVVFVHPADEGGRHRVNLAVFDMNGNVHQRHRVLVVQDGDQAPAAGEPGFAMWMSFQVGQARSQEAMNVTIKSPVVESYEGLAPGGEPVKIGRLVEASIEAVRNYDSARGFTESDAVPGGPSSSD